MKTRKVAYALGILSLFPVISGLSCTFETDICEFTQNTNDQNDWTRKSGSIPKTGPSGDHTTGTYGHYMYVTSVNHPSSAILERNITIPENSFLIFYHYINDGTLMVYFDDQRYWQSDRAGTSWNKAKLHVNLTGRHRLSFQGTFGSTSDGVVALDDVYVLKGRAHNDGCELFKFGSQCELGVSLAIGVLIVVFASILLVLCCFVICLYCCRRKM